MRSTFECAVCQPGGTHRQQVSSPACHEEKYQGTWWWGIIGRILSLGIYISIHACICTYIYICKTTLHCSVLTYTIKYGKLEYYNINIIIVNNTAVQYNTISTVHYTGRMQCSRLWYLVTVHSSHITEDPITREWVFHGFGETFDEVTDFGGGGILSALARFLDIDVAKDF